MTLTEKCLAFSGLFEAELLIELMLRYWSHPLALDEEFRTALLEGAADALRSCIAGQQLMEDIPPDQMNLVAAAWYAEWNALSSGVEDPQGQRQLWLDNLRQAIPSCFCRPDRLV
jgi:hypothetical protein